MENLYPILKKTSLIFILIILSLFESVGQVRFQQNIRGGFAVAMNGLVDDPANCQCENYGVKINKAGGTSMSSSSDLILPAGSTVVSAFLYVEGFTNNGKKINSVKFRVPGGAYVTLNNLSPGFKANRVDPSASFAQFIIDVTSMIPANGYVSTVVPGGDPSNAGRYSVADIGNFDASNYGYGWSLIVAYTNPGSNYRNITIVDNGGVYGGLGCTGTGSCSYSFNVTGINVPSSGAFNAAVFASGTYGDDGLSDYIQLGKTGGTMTKLVNPTTGNANDAYASTIGMCPKNDVTVDGGPLISGYFKARNPYVYNDPNTSAATWSSYFYDASIYDASSPILPNSATPISVTFKQTSPDVSGGDVLAAGAYVISIDIVSALVTKSLAPTSITDGGIATYTWTITNTQPGALNMSGIGFTDNLPANIIVTSPNGASITGGTGGAITASPGASTVSLSGLSLNSGETATMKVNVTNKPGNLNADCSTNPLAFTNGFSNISGVSAGLTNGVANQCLLVTAATLPIGLVNFDAVQIKNKVMLSWTTASENNSAYFEIEKYIETNGYSKIGTDVKADGNSATSKQYSLEDNYPTGGINYYRLKQIGIDGKVDYSPIIKTIFSSKIDKVNIDPQPVIDMAHLNILAENDETVQVIVYDLVGKQVIKLNAIGLNKGQNSITIDLSTLEIGNYFLKVSDSNGSLNSIVRIMKN